nr:hypothetical protein [Gilvimarinus xylanilyticus]
MQSSRAEITQSAQQINQAAAGDTSQSLAEPLVNMQVQQQVFDSSARVLETANETMGTLLDIKA